MREIKFRAWDKKLKAWAIMATTDTNYDDHSFGFLDRGGFDLMQYTGLIDRKGAQIYEGDIVQSREHKAEIKWNDQEAKFDFWDPETEEFEGQWHDDLTSLDTEEVGVIGNICENPELLK